MSSVILVSPRSDWAAPTARALQEDGLEVRVMPTGERAIDAFVQEPTAVVVVELDLPGRDGAATVESIRWAPGGEEALVVLVGLDADPARVRQVALALRARSVPGGELDTLRATLASLATPMEEQPLTGEVTREVDTDELAERARAGIRESETRSARAPQETVEANPFADETRPVDLDLVDGPGDPGDPHPGDAEGREVEARARVLQEVARIEGDLAKVPFATILARLGELRVSGALLLASEADQRATTTHESPKKVVFFRNGIPRHVRSNLVTECLGQVLARQGWIDRATLDDSLERVRAGAGKQGSVLVAMGALEPRRLREALELEQREKLFDLFAWPEGRFRFSEAMEPPGETVALEMSMAQMVYEGLQRVPGPRLLAAIEPLMDRYPWPEPSRVPGLRRAVDPAGRALLDRLDGQATTRALLEAAPSMLDGARLIRAGASLGALTFHDAPSAAAMERPASGLIDLRSEVRRLALLLRDGQYAMALRVRPGDGVGAERAADELERAIRQDLAGTPEGTLRTAELKAAAFEVLSRLPRAALAVSGDFDRPSMPPPASGSASGSAAPLTPPRGETAELYESPWSDSTSTDEGDESGKGDERGGGVGAAENPWADATDTCADDPVGLEALEAQILGAIAETPADPRPPEPSTDERELPDIPEVITTQARPGARPSADLERIPTVHERPPARAEAEAPPSGAAEPEPSDLDERVERMLRAERFFRRGCRALARDDHAPAREAFQEAVALAPEEGEFLAHLGWARVCTGSDDGETVARGLSELQKAAQMVPKMAKAHLWLARALRDRGDLAAARDAYGDALAADPELAVALAELQALGAS